MVKLGKLKLERNAALSVLMVDDYAVSMPMVVAAVAEAELADAVRALKLAAKLLSEHAEASPLTPVSATEMALTALLVKLGVEV